MLKKYSALTLLFVASAACVPSIPTNRVTLGHLKAGQQAKQKAIAKYIAAGKYEQADKIKEDFLKIDQLLRDQERDKRRAQKRADDEAMEEVYEWERRQKKLAQRKEQEQKERALSEFRNSRNRALREVFCKALSPELIDIVVGYDPVDEVVLAQPLSQDDQVGQPDPVEQPASSRQNRRAIGCGNCIIL